MSSLNISINKSTLNLKNSYLDTHTWFLDYNDVKYLLWNAKYRQEFSIYNKFIKKIAIQLTDLDNVDFITNVPTSKHHITKRGFDHGEYLGRTFSKNLMLTYKNLLIPVHDIDQVHSSGDMRRKLPRYMCKKNIYNKKILIIDDIATTRTSLNRCAQALKEKGANRVDAVTIAFRHLQHY
ncbi:MAG: ComF family protein [Acidimicrobiia bacterium]|nr:ComF family protein [Acidimicrobiia bacterium]